jgi:hypothetical protein
VQSLVDELNGFARSEKFLALFDFYAANLSLRRVLPAKYDGLVQFQRTNSHSSICLGLNGLLREDFHYHVYAPIDRCNHNPENQISHACMHDSTVDVGARELCMYAHEFIPAICVRIS